VQLLLPSAVSFADSADSADSAPDDSEPIDAEPNTGADDPGTDDPGTVADTIPAGPDAVRQLLELV